MIELLARHRTAGNLLMLVLMLGGGLMATGVRRELYPDITPKKVEVRVPFPGASTEEVEESVCRPIEEALDAVQQVHELKSEARQGLALVTAEMVEGGDMTAFHADIDAEVAAITSFPEGVEEPVISRTGREDVVMAVLVGGFSDALDLYAYCDDLAVRLRRLPALSTVDLEGFSDRQLRVELDHAALVAHGLSVADVASAIAAESVDRPAGSVETDQRELSVRFTERRRTPQELADLVVRETAGGGRVTLGALGVVRDLFEDAEDRVEVDGRRVGRLVVRKAKTDDSLDVAQAVRDFVAAEQQRAPPGVTLWLTEDGSRGLRDQLQLVITNGWQGMLLVFLTMWLFFTPRLAFWVVLSLPVSFLGAFLFLPAAGLTINVMTLVGLLLALGILMDDGIVIAENVSSHLERGQEALRAAVDGTREVLPGVVSSFLTTVCVLGPLSVLEGDIGKVLGVVPVILVLVLVVSLAEAFWILPGHLAHALAHAGKAPGRFRRWFEGRVAALRDGPVQGLVALALERRYLFVGGMGALLLLALGLLASGRVAFQAFPSTEGDVLVSRVLMPPGTPLARTQEVVDQILAGLEATERELADQQPEGAALVELVNVRFNVNKDAHESGPHLATVAVDLLTTERRGSRLDDIQAAWAAHTGPVLDALSVTFVEPATGGPAGRAIEVRLVGEDLERCDRAAAEVLEWFAGFGGVSNLSDDLRPGRPELRVTMDSGARGLGLTAASLADQVSAAFLGRVADEIQVGADAYEVEVRLADGDRASVDDLAGFRVQLPGGGEAALGSVATIREGRGWSRIARVDGQRSVTITGDVDDRVTNTARLFAAFRTEFVPGFLERWPDLTLDLEGETSEGPKTMASMLQGMLLGVLGVYVLLSLQFRSYSEPLLIMVLIPLTLIGVLGGHLLLGYPFTLPSLLGYIALAGIVVNDSILLVTFTRQAIAAGKPAREAAREGSRARFRAVLLTSATTVVGLLPLLFETSVQAQMLKGLVISISFGMLASTVLVLMVVPALFAILDDLDLLGEPAAGH